jgi:hypothetical protein
MRLDTMATPCSRLRSRGGWAEDLMGDRCSFPIGPWNTWSNVAYLLAGCYIWGWDRSLAGIVMGWSLVILGVGSLLYHGFKTVETNKMDRAGMYLVFGALSIHALPATEWTPWVMLLTGILLAVLFNYVLNNVNLDVQMGVLFYYTLAAGLMYGDRELSLQSFGVFCGALLAWQMDKRGSKWVGKYGHALWHCLTALAIPMMYLAQ